MPAKELGMDEFLAHSSRDKGDRLGNWKDDKKLDTFLHRKHGPVALWRHNVPVVALQEDEDGETKRNVWGRDMVCYEDEAVLKSQYKRDDRTGRRIKPPKHCGICRLIDWVEMQIWEGGVDWKDPLFRFVADDSDYTRVVHMGGICNMYKRDLSKEDRNELKEAGINVAEGWKESMYAKLSYLLVVVKAEAPEEGVQVGVETGALGDAIKAVIGDEIEGKGDKGNPFLHPYCIRWKYDAEEKNFGKKYRANRIDTVPCTPEIMALISGDRVDISSFTRLYDQDEVRAQFEAACIAKQAIPWDEIFAVEPLPEEKPRVAAKKAATPPEDEEVECDKCGLAMPVKAPVCQNCGQRYDVSTTAATTAKVEAPKPTPQGRRR